MKKLLSLTRAAVDRYNMIEAGDRIAVGVSGGKDSIALLYALASLRGFYPRPFELVAVTLDYRFNGEDGDFSEIQQLCDSLQVKYVVQATDLWKVIFETRQEKNPCSLCAKMRRGILHDTAKALGCNKIALGHHLDDAAETLVMNLFNGGRVKCFSPVSYLSRKALYMIRPLVFAREKDIACAVKSKALPIVKSRCPADGVTERERTKQLLTTLEADYPGLREKIVGALQREKIDNW